MSITEWSLALRMRKSRRLFTGYSHKCVREHICKLLTCLFLTYEVENPSSVNVSRDRASYACLSASVSVANIKQRDYLSLAITYFTAQPGASC